MASDKDPSIYSERSSIGSSDELDEYGVWVKSEPQDLSSVGDAPPAFPEESIEPSLPDLEDLPDLDLGQEEFDIPDIHAEQLPAFEDMENLDEEPPVDTPKNDQTDDFTELSMDDFLSEDNGDTELDSMPPLGPDAGFDDIMEDLADSPADDVPVELELSQSGGYPESVGAEAPFDDVSAVEDQLRSVEAKVQEVPKAAPDLSTQLLMRIAEELSSIKNELSSLKTELTTLRGAAAAAEPEKENAAESGEAHGFFDEEDDEKIALTGDELDNILNTADFTEEAGTDVTVDDGEFSFLESDEAPLQEPQAAPEEFLSDKEDLLQDGAEDGPEIERIDTDFSEEASSDAPAASSVEGLEDLLENGVQPMTEAPEDTSYLESEALQMDDLDLSEAVIDEPDLGNIVLEEAPVEEPSIESINIDLDMEEPLHMEEQDQASGAEEEIEEMELNLGEETLEGEPEAEAEPFGDIAEGPADASADALPSFEAIEAEDAPLSDESFSEVLPEGFVVEPEGSEGEEFLPQNILIPEEELEDMALESEEFLPSEEVREEPAEAPVREAPVSPGTDELPSNLKMEVKAVLSYMDQLLESLPEEKIEEFAKSEYFESYKKLFEELGLA